MISRCETYEERNGPRRLDKTQVLVVRWRLFGILIFKSEIALSVT